MKAGNILTAQRNKSPSFIITDLLFQIGLSRLK